MAVVSLTHSWRKETTISTSPRSWGHSFGTQLERQVEVGLTQELGADPQQLEAGFGVALQGEECLQHGRAPAFSFPSLLDEGRMKWVNTSAQ
jgi:hypothetical protein